MPVKGQKRKILHTNKILDFQKINRDSIWPGTILQFRYTSKGRFDKRPLILCLFIDQANDVIHGINFNYLSEYLVQKLFTYIHGMIKIDQNNQDIKTLTEPITRVKMLRHGESEAKILYERVIKPRILVSDDCYRTYSLRKMTDIDAIRYQVDIITEIKEAIIEARKESKTNKMQNVKSKKGKAR